MSKNRKLASNILEDMVASAKVDKVTLCEVKEALHEWGFCILIIIFSLPVSLPIPVPPGYTTILCIPLILFSSQLFLGFNSPWMPKWLEKKSFQLSTLAFMVEKTSPALKKVENFTKSRISFIFYGPGEKILVFIILLCAISIANPLPFTHFTPAISIILISFGIMNKDGLIAMLGVLTSLFGLLLTIIIMIKGPKLIIGAFSLLKSLV